MEPQRLSSISVNDFIGLLESGTPAIICDAMKDWPGSQEWTPAYFRDTFGSEYVQIYNDAFDLKDIRPLSYYLNTFFQRNRMDDPKAIPYVRWYTKLKDVDFVWANHIFQALKNQWSMPYFMPEDGYLLPFTQAPERVNPVEDLFPAKGLFISGAGAKTRLHCDPWQSDALLFQVYGEKAWVLYPPDQSGLLRNSRGECVDLDHPDPNQFPQFYKAKPGYTFTLKPGDTVLVPQGWFHQVITTTDAISITWNFAHRATQSNFLNYLDAQSATCDDLEVLQFFFSKWLPKNASCAQIAQFIREKLEQP